MREITGNLWNYWQMRYYCMDCLKPMLHPLTDCGTKDCRSLAIPSAFHICITTNGDVNARGHAVMGRGCALEASKKIPGFSRALAYVIKKYGNHVYRMDAQLQGLSRVLVFPVKYHWHEMADLSLIRRSARELAEICALTANSIFILPRPGCGNGHLNWEDVREVIAPILPDNVWVITHA